MITESTTLAELRDFAKDRLVVSIELRAKVYGLRYDAKVTHLVGASAEGSGATIATAIADAIANMPFGTGLR